MSQQTEVPFSGWCEHVKGEDGAYYWRVPGYEPAWEEPGCFTYFLNRKSNKQVVQELEFVETFTSEQTNKQYTVFKVI